jgi:hypothetical protein
MMANDPIEGDAEAYRKFLENPEEFFTQLPNRNVEPRKQIPRRRLGQKDSAGYGRPPTATRWKPGQSGNPKGRPKGSQNLRSAIEKMLIDKITLREGDKVRRVTRLEAVMRKQLEMALRGDRKATQSVYALADAFGLLDARPLGLVLDHLGVLTTPELIEFERLLSKMNGRVEPKWF